LALDVPLRVETGG